MFQTTLPAVILFKMKINWNKNQHTSYYLVFFSYYQTKTNISQTTLAAVTLFVIKT